MSQNLDDYSHYGWASHLCLNSWGRGAGPIIRQEKEGQGFGRRNFSGMTFQRNCLCGFLKPVLPRGYIRVTRQLHPDTLSYSLKAGAQV